VVCGALVLAPAFSSVDTDAARKPNRFILSTVSNKPMKTFCYISLILLFLISCKDFNYNYGSFSDTTDFSIDDYKFYIDSLNSGITINNNVNTVLRDSIYIYFLSSFKNEYAQLFLNKQTIYNDTLITDLILGVADWVVIRRNDYNNNFELRINSKRYLFTEFNDYNNIYIAKQDSLMIIYTNKLYALE
jgi:hypothetical protein